MKKRYKIILLVVAIATFACVFTGCNVVDDVKGFVDQLTCEHKYGDKPEESLAATCTSEGYVIHRCVNCQYLEKTKVEMLAHTEVDIEAIPSTCTEVGYTSGKECSVCKKITVHPVKIPATGHTEVIDAHVPATCLTSGLTEGKHCSICEEVLVEQKVVKALGHNVETLGAVAPTCTESGLTKGYKCGRCDEIFTAQIVLPALGHVGEMGEECSVCEELIGIKEALASQYTTASLEVGEKLQTGTIYRVEKTGLNAILFGADFGEDTTIKSVALAGSSYGDNFGYPSARMFFSIYDEHISATDGVFVGVDDNGSIVFADMDSSDYSGFQFYEDDNYIYYLFYGNCITLSSDVLHELVPSGLTPEMISSVSFADYTLLLVEGNATRLVF